MYVWIWRHLPGGLPGRLLGSVLLLAAAVTVLMLAVFPRVEPLLPFQNVTVNAPGTGSGQGAPGPVPSR